MSKKHMDTFRWVIATVFLTSGILYGIGQNMKASNIFTMLMDGICVGTYITLATERKRP